VLDGVSLTRPTCPQLRSATSRKWKILSSSHRRRSGVAPSSTRGPRHSGLFAWTATCADQPNTRSGITMPLAAECNTPGPVAVLAVSNRFV
jgi:hypothetical protein